MPARFRDKTLIVFDLDGTLTETKSNMDRETARLLCGLLRDKRVAVIGGGAYQQFRAQFLAHLPCPKERFKNLFLFPTTSTSFYRYARGWRKVYAKRFSPREKRAIKHAFRAALREIRYVPPRKTYGKVIEDRGAQITFSALGQDVVKILGEKKGVALKTQWKKQHAALKLKLAQTLQKRLPGFEVRASGFTSIDVTHKGIDKAYGIREIEKHLRIPRRKMLFVGDALFPGGNDYAARRTGVTCVSVSGPKQTKKLVRSLL
ncbi:MAG: hypothetical protein A3A43_03215 [Candidatus Liptonbacteria bacterium RIFCSPLOWO2_01_FULL_56_20]|uniref:phosphomannomutase n=1 Tax=Candidatus Liptonbacteria bacterium RIFCSPLOWO2_01_FULL_56_20 TaxID=1798652 RepID=A0A1G2CJP4_9BACT|nr:MAG: HAD-superfamily hydrolase subfamily IIB [Parcubacteria group bacterium GW2011_GWB1_56_8]OGY97795.1 MAG: hypothetical protein A2681_01200 [Candidatus Liptonbacteria bacterium RIFCSPHIGHO2_01_FULL_56_18b]OGZ00638.1 MAG: hypothetical protein A3A43_03215 [Candidatus Liptonbacteria bacterium RIFCSPLOWO2_01_FULL_56_20]